LEAGVIIDGNLVLNIVTSVVVPVIIDVRAAHESTDQQVWVVSGVVKITVENLGDTRTENTRGVSKIMHTVYHSKRTTKGSFKPFSYSFFSKIDL